MKILIVDDTETSLLLSTRILEKYGHVVMAADSGQAALERLGKEDFDLVFMDVQMPEMSGIETARIIRSGASPVRRRDIPIVAVTAGNEADKSYGKKECLNAGMNGYLQKPVKAQDVIVIVEQYRNGGVVHREQ